MSQSVNVTQLALAVENLLAPLAAQAQRSGERAQQLDNLRNVVVVLAVLCTGLGIEEVVAGDELEYLEERLGQGQGSGGTRDARREPHTMAAMLQTSVLAPHLDPRITSGERYCLVWISLVKWWLTQHALPRSAILTLITSKACESSALRLSPVEAEEPLDLSSEMPDTSRVRISLRRDVEISNLAPETSMHPDGGHTQTFPAASASRRRISGVVLSCR